MAAKRAARTPLMAGNWKMNLDHLQAAHFVQKLDWTLKDAKHDFAAVEVAVLVPYTDIRTVQTLIDGDHLDIRYGAQDVSTHEHGAYTGEVSAQMLAKLGCSYVVVGHSERREYHGEDDAEVGAKLRMVLAHGMTPLLCVGEGLPTREAGEQVLFTLAQVAAALDRVSADQAADLVIAYEPLWAIGTGHVATPEDAQEVCAAIRAELGRLYSTEQATRTRVLYGGSVKAGNIAATMAQLDVDGALVGGASIDPDEFATICRYREHVTGG